MNLIFISLIGLLGGLVSGLFGVGGGVVFVPLLVLLCHFDVHLAIGTSLAAIVPTAAVAALRHGLSGMADWRTAVCLAVFAVAGAWFGSMLSMKIDAHLLKRFYALFLLLLSLKLFFQK
ncbi:MAG: hypothetical protein A2Z83_02945 [Omnitrophica bacterium GWA2_52_8]|nr:MAG: hypothetical protein A2Z83_02945 [Omnitrophica bacterium GWA2_52_8]